MLRVSVIIALSVGACHPLWGADANATVTEAVNDVRYGSASATETESARVGSKVTNGQYLKTGVKSRAELQLANLSITRLGANTIFDYNEGTNTIDLQAGTVLFSKPKDSTQMNIKTASVTAAVLGTTGFIQVKDKTFAFGLIEGEARVIIKGITYRVGAGEVLRTTGGSAPEVLAYNVPHFLETSPLMTLFHSQLPNQAYINQEVADYNDEVARGFITPPTGPYFAGVEGAVPTVPTGVPDQAQRAHYVFDVTTASASPAKTGEFIVPARPHRPY